MQTSSEHNKTVNQVDLRQQIAEGLLYIQTRLNANQRKTLVAAAFLHCWSNF